MKTALRSQSILFHVAVVVTVRVKVILNVQFTYTSQNYVLSNVLAFSSTFFCAYVSPDLFLFLFTIVLFYYCILLLQCGTKYNNSG